MLDVARTPYPLSYLKDVIRTMAWYKMNDLHLVINNSYIFHEHYVDNGHDPFKESYAAFRLESKMKGKDGTPLTAKDLFYTKKEFADLVSYARKYGVNIVPEFDTPQSANTGRPNLGSFSMYSSKTLLTRSIVSGLAASSISQRRFS